MEHVGIQIPFTAFISRLGRITANDMLNALVVTKKNKYGTRRFKLYDIKNNCLILPKSKGKFIQQLKIPYRCTFTTPYRTSYKTMSYSDMILYDYQHEAAEYIEHKFLSTNLNDHIQYIQLDTGLGKSRIAIAIIMRMAVPAIIVVPTIAIRNQWSEEICEMLPLASVAVSTARADLDNRELFNETRPSHDIFIFVINTFAKLPHHLLNGIGLIVIDEAHELTCTRGLDTLWRATVAKYVLGLSATPKSPSVTTHFLGRPVTNICNVSDVNFQVHIQEQPYWAADAKYYAPIMSKSGNISFAETLTRLIKDPERLKVVADAVLRLFYAHLSPIAASHNLLDGRKHCIFVFAERRNYLPLIATAIKEAHETYIAEKKLCFDAKDIDSAIYAPEILQGGVTAETLERAKNARIVLTTYGYSRRGVSIRAMTAIVLATPRKNGMRQIIGRILRRGSDETIIRQVIDIIDSRSPLAYQVKTRREVYKLFR